MTAVAVVAHHEREVAAALAEGAVDVAHRARARGVDRARRRRPRSASRSSSASGRSTQADLVVCLGGDGTMLRAVRLLDGASVPLLGVNVGVLGYLTEIEPPELQPALERFLAGPDAGYVAPRRADDAARRDHRRLRRRRGGRSTRR